MIQALRSWQKRSTWLLGVYGLCIILLLYERLIAANAFSSFDVQSLVDGTLPLALVAMAQACVVLTGGIDLSVGAMMTLANVVAANWMVHANFGESLAISIAIVLGGACLGILNALAVNITRVPDIIVTLATSAILGGAALQVMPTPAGGVPQEFSDFLTGSVGATAIPVGLVVLPLLVLLVWLPVRRSRLGLAIYALGSNRTAAFLSGVNVAQTRVLAYGLGGAFSALGGLVLTAQTQNGSASSGSSYTLNSVAAIVIGGVALTGGKGGMMGPIVAAFIITLITNILGFLNVDPNYAMVIQGIVVVLAVMIGGLLLRPVEVRRLLIVARGIFRGGPTTSTSQQEE